MIDLFLNRGANIEAATKNGRTPLYRAASSGRVEVADLLLNRGANIEAAAEHGGTPLNVAAYNGSVGAIELLLNRGARIEAATKDGLTPLHQAAGSGRVEVADLLLDRGANIEAATEHGGTPLHVAAYNGSVGAIEFLLNRGARIEAVDNYGRTSLHWAVAENTSVAESDSVDVVDLLLSHGANIEAKDSSGKTPLDAAPPGAVRSVLETAVSRDDDRRRDGEVFRDDCDFCPDLVVVPAGEFRMGGTASSAHRVRVGRFALGRYEVMRKEYEVFVEATGHVGDGCTLMGYREEEDGARTLRWGFVSNVSWRESMQWIEQVAGNYPVVCVSWPDARAYVAWLSRETGKSYRLPSEAEWQYAARAGATTQWYWGNESTDRCKYANTMDASFQRIVVDEVLPNTDFAVSDCVDGAAGLETVGAYRVNAFGLHDVSGNVSEWVEDCWHDDYVGAPDDGTAWTTGGDCGLRLIQGGSWISRPGELSLRARHRGTTEVRRSDLGFRVARTLD